MVVTEVEGEQILARWLEPVSKEVKCFAGLTIFNYFMLDRNHCGKSINVACNEYYVAGNQHHLFSLNLTFRKKERKK